MKKLIFTLSLLLSINAINATIHVIEVWDGYYQFLPSQLTIQLGDTIQWLPLDPPQMAHTVTSADIPLGAEEFDYLWQAPADTFFQFIPEFIGVYNYVCTPHEISFGMIGSFTVEGPSSIEEMQIDLVSIYPNPAQNSISLTNIKNGVPYRIIDLNGREVLNGSVTSNIDISSLQKGVYFIELIAIEPTLLKFIKY